MTATTAEEQRILDLLHTPGQTYESVQEQTGWSKGKIYALALRAGARKTEARIRERADERRQRQEETLREILNTTAKSDVLDFLDGIPNDTAAMVLTSPPYNVGKSYGGCPGADSMRHVYYHGWLLQILSECARILREGGRLFLQIGSTRDHEDRLMPLDILLFDDIRRTGLQFETRIVWAIPHGLTPTRRLAERHETALVFSKGEPATFNASAARIPQKNPAKRAFKGPKKGALSGNLLGAWPTNVWYNTAVTDFWNDIPNVKHNHPDRRHGTHEAQFPLELCCRAITLYTMPGDLVVDPFNGSGTTQAACIQNRRNFVGADLFYEDLRAKRLAETFPALVSPLPGVISESLAVWQAEARRIDTPAAGSANTTQDLFPTTAA